VFYGQFIQDSAGASVQLSLPSVLDRLGPRQQEIAGIVYSATAATPRDVQARLSDRRSLRVVRTLLDRMVAKGVLKRRRSGRHNEIIYIAAIVTPTVKEVAVRRLVDEQFNGSFDDAALTITKLARRAPKIPQTYAAVRRLVNERSRERLSFLSRSAIQACV